MRRIMLVKSEGQKREGSILSYYISAVSYCWPCYVKNAELSTCYCVVTNADQEEGFNASDFPHIFSAFFQDGRGCHEHPTDVCCCQPYGNLSSHFLSFLFSLLISTPPLFIVFHFIHIIFCQISSDGLISSLTVCYKMDRKYLKPKL